VSRPSTTVRTLVAEATQLLAAAGVESARVDATLLLEHVLGASRAALVTVRSVEADDGVRFRELVARRAGREPLQYLTGEAPFRFTMVAVGPGVFIPRPETELLIDAVLPALRAISAPVAVDLCAGSGALAVALADEVPTARVIAIERSPAALAWLERNAAGRGIDVVAGDIRTPDLCRDLEGLVDVIVSNPPYVPTTTAVSPEVGHDPAEAVFAGVDGLAVLPAVIASARRLLRRGGVVAIEHDETQAAAVLALFDDAGWTAATDHHDLTGRDRYVTAVRA
jgi:release factor glutamine methyltransferase